jgi:hypothetical protein
MAEDLIPPPSPAGRPQPESSAGAAARAADGLWSGGEQAPRPGASALPDGVAARATDPPGRSPYRSRFAAVAGLVIAVALAVAGIGTLLALDASDKPARDGWSAWRPAGPGGLAGAKQIAAHVAVKYRLDDERQLVAVQASGMEMAGRPLSVALAPKQAGGDVRLLEGNGVKYTLNGLGENGSIRGGKASEARHLLLRREALELSLYTLRYGEDVDMVVTLLPPPPPKPGEPEVAGQKPVQALMFRPADLRGQLGAPLAATLTPRTPRPGQLAPGTPEAKRIDALTLTNLFTANFRQSQDASLFLVLER